MLDQTDKNCIKGQSIEIPTWPPWSIPTAGAGCMFHLTVEHLRHMARASRKVTR